MSGRDAVLLTGASGVVGRAVLRELTGRPVICLVHRGTVPVADGVEVVVCDLARQRLGLSTTDFFALARRTRAVVHSAALTEWGQPEYRYTKVNVDGTARVIELARAAGAPVHYVSSAFVAALRPDVPAHPRHDNVIMGYLRSKLTGELMLAESGLPHSIYRPTNLIGDSATGWTARPQIIQLMSDWVCRGRAPFFPAHPGNRLDLAPQDLMARALVAALAAGESGGDYWIAYGDAAMTVAEGLRLLVEHARGRGRELVAPPVRHPADIAPAELAALPPMSRRYVRVLSDASEVVACGGGVLPSSLPVLADRFGLTAGSDVLAYRRTLAAADRRAPVRTPAMQETS